MLVVGRDPGTEETRQGRPFVGPAGRVLDEALAEAGVERKTINVTNVVGHQPAGNNFGAHSDAQISEGCEALLDLCERLRPNVVVALGNEACHALIPSWPDNGRGIRGATGILDRRGYVFDGFGGLKVVATVHPSGLLRGGWIPFRPFLTEDLKRARKEAAYADIQRTDHNIEIVAEVDAARRILDDLRHANVHRRRLACDIEIYGDHTLACVGIATGRSRAFVFCGAALEPLLGFLSSRAGRDGRRFVFANGGFDLHYLLTRADTRVEGYADDTQLAFHSCYPQLAGKDDSKSWQMTRKGLAVVTSLYCDTPEWWKDYDFETETERYVLCGHDVCYTFEAMDGLDTVIDTLEVREIYEHEISLVWPCVDAQRRGFLVDDSLRLSRIDELQELADDVNNDLNDVVVPLLEASEDLDRAHLFEDVWTCPCCRNGSGKRDRCWSCAGFDSAPRKPELVALASRLGIDSEGLRKADLIEACLGPCVECSGDGQRRRLVYNPRSNEQSEIVVYELLRLPKRLEKGKLSVKAEKLRSLLPYVT